MSSEKKAGASSGSQEDHASHHEDNPTTETCSSLLEPSIEPPPDGGYGWVCCGALSTLNGFTWGVAASYGIYISHYLADDYFPGARPLDFALIGGLEFGVAMIISPLCTISTRELGRFVVMFSGCVMFAGGFVAASFASEIWQLYLSQGVLVGLGLGAVFIPSIQVLPQWFEKRRSLAGGIASAGSGFGGLAFSLGTNAMIEQISLAWALRITGILCFVGNLTATLLVKDRNHVVKPPQLGFATHLLKRYDCLLLLSWCFINLFGYMALLYSLSNYAVVVVGLTQSQASILTAVLNLGTGFGRPAIGLASDRLGRIEVAACATLINAILIFGMWIPGNSYGVLIVFSILAGAFIGTFWMTIGPLCAEVAGLSEVPSLLSLQWLTTVLPTTFAEVIALYLRRPGMGRWAYLYTQIFAGTMYLIASLFLFELWRVKRKKRSELSSTATGTNN
ncbi:Putative major facilitator superfamily, MFS transporter superfamily [Septoria linicola]|uniref:Major facilitator superfamily, MFS transporter superfamily n=1 Tax=Septoria linicola TaxID=215465 RepID=A0A9Q9AX33_9PEZI|nr:Putative major facilitator superfamily, MFS transporter superfamily [Septoria linicola]